eukprot:4089247-Ditylum_brightwellii.AAC.1
MGGSSTAVISISSASHRISAGYLAVSHWFASVLSEQHDVLLFELGCALGQHTMHPLHGNPKMSACVA